MRFDWAKSIVKGVIVCLSCTFAVMVPLILTLDFALRRDQPGFEVVDVQRAGDSLGLLNVSDGRIVPHVNFILRSHNPNNMAIKCKTKHALTVRSRTNRTGGGIIGEASLPRFSQGKRSDKNVTAGWSTPQELEDSLLSVLRQNITNDLVIVTLSGTVEVKVVIVSILVDLRCLVGFRPFNVSLASEYTKCGVGISVDQT